jgi:hypothetical protein
MALNIPRPVAARSLAKHRYPSQTRRNLLEQLQPFSAGGVIVSSKAGDIPARTRETFDIAGGDGVGDQREHDWDSAVHLHQSRDDGAGMSEDHVRRERNHLSGVSAPRIGIIVGPAIVDEDIFAGNPAQLLESLHNGRNARLSFRIVFRKR